MTTEPSFTPVPPILPILPSTPVFTWGDALRHGLHAARVNLLPGSLLWMVALTVVCAYYFHEPAEALLTRLAELKERANYLFAMLSTAFFAGLLPLIFQHLQPAAQRREPWRMLPFLLVFWALRGAEVEFLYRLQAWLWGDDAHWRTVAAKVVFDQFVYCPFWAVLVTIFAYLWKDNGFSIRRTRAALGRQWIRRRVVPMLLSNFAVWFPTAVAIYLLPLPLQLPLQNIVLCLWVLMVIVLTRHEKD